MQKKKCWNISGGIIAFLGVLVVTAGVVLIFIGDDLIANAVKKACRLTEGTTVYKLWHDSPVPMYNHIYVFSLENENDFLNGAAPKLTQRGPFVYREDRKKVEVVTYPNQTISYNETRTYTFQPDLSAESENVTITTINLVYMTLVSFLQQKDVPNTVRKIIGDILPVAKENVLMKLTVKGLLWGYKDPILAQLVKFSTGLFTMDTVSIYNASVSNAGLNKFLINDGVDLENSTDRINEVGLIEKFNFADRLDSWSNEYANAINGTDSTLWHPTVLKNETVYTFISDICRSVYLTFNETRQNNYDIENYRFTLPDTVFANTTENRGFCLFNRTANGTTCLPSGLFSLSSCVKLGGNSLAIPLPIIASSPHFLGADASVRDAVEGLEPNDADHRSYVDIEPITGIVMNGSRRLQINLQVINDKEITALQNVTRVVYPMIWLNEHAEIDSDHASDFRKEVYLPMTAIKVVKYLFPSVGSVMILSSIGIFIWIRKTRSRNTAFGRADPNERTPLRS